jgi:hypothetical protein
MARMVGAARVLCDETVASRDEPARSLFPHTRSTNRELETAATELIQRSGSDGVTTEPKSVPSHPAFIMGRNAVHS